MKYSRFADFYPFYLSQHGDRTCRRLHFAFEKNRPATFTHPVYSFMGDWVMWKDILTGRIRL